MKKSPRCLAEVVARSTDDPGVDLDTLVDEWPNEFFALSCRCSSELFTVESYISRYSYPSGLQEDQAYGPLTATCCACSRTAKIFDPDLHGYDVEIDHFPGHAPYSGDWRVYECSSCFARAFALIARFQYPTSGVGEAERRPDGSLVPKEDLFSYFTLIARCSVCSAVSTISSVECA